MIKRIAMNRRYYLYSAAIIVVLLSLVFINEKRGNHFEKSVNDTHDLFITADPTISLEEIDAAGSEILRLDILSGEPRRESSNYIAIPIDEISEPEFLKRLKKHKGLIAIITNDLKLVAPAWVILTRMGISNIRILDADDYETLRYTFEPQVREES